MLWWAAIQLAFSLGNPHATNFMFIRFVSMGISLKCIFIVGVLLDCFLGLFSGVSRGKCVGDGVSLSATRDFCDLKPKVLVNLQQTRGITEWTSRPCESLRITRSNCIVLILRGPWLSFPTKGVAVPSQTVLVIAEIGWRVLNLCVRICVRVWERRSVESTLIGQWVWLVPSLWKIWISVQPHCFRPWLTNRL